MDSIESGADRISYFDLTKKSKNLPLSHSCVAIVAGQFSATTDRSEYAAHFQKFFKRAQQSGSEGVAQFQPQSSQQNPNNSANSNSDKITGMLLVFRTCFVHVVEAPQKIIYAFLEEVAAGSRDHVTDAARILVFSDNLKRTLPPQSQSQSQSQPQLTRNFPFWASKIIDSKDDGGPIDWAGMDDSSLDEQITTACVNLLSVGQSLSLMNKADIKHAFEDISDRFRAQLPSMGMVSAIAQHPGILSISDWHHEFHGHMPLTLESDRVWPAQNPILFA